MRVCKGCSNEYEYIRSKGHGPSLCGSCTTSRNRKKKKLKCLAYKGGKCEVCGYDRSAQALQFHHPDANKDFNVSHNLFRKWELIRAELDKCVLLCANCHAEEHDRLRDWRTEWEPEKKETRQHGKRSTYNHHRCRCELCTEAHTSYMRDYKRRVDKPLEKRENTG